jgi:hypothetical protein
MKNSEIKSTAKILGLWEVDGEKYLWTDGDFIVPHCIIAVVARAIKRAKLETDLKWTRKLNCQPATKIREIHRIEQQLKELKEG